ncbi:hypothetical protein DTO271D3_3516 [Paecilomyces variotii]|nr:hypothetical protein DTO169C6_1246 [Paecilomyces variotii]KAJ9316247.1 hypothetical protein DTO271D3_3516 [Paecilomyces variotii]
MRSLFKTSNFAQVKLPRPVPPCFVRRATIAELPEYLQAGTKPILTSLLFSSWFQRHWLFRALRPNY